VARPGEAVRGQSRPAWACSPAPRSCRHHCCFCPPRVGPREVEDTQVDPLLALERADPSVVDTSVWGALPSLQGAPTETAACEIAVAAVRRLTGFDRVMVYRFTPDWSGEVVAEARGDGVASYLCTPLPASDLA